MPSITTNTGSVGATLETRNNTLSGSLLFNGKSLVNASTFNPTTVVYSGSKLPTDDTSKQITNMVKALQSAYSGTDITAINQNITTLLNTSSGQIASLGAILLTNQLGGVVNSGSTDVVVNGNNFFG